MPDQTQEPLKVYELAKELGIDSFALLDKLKSINIEVKSHMSSLEVEQAKLIREALKKDKKSDSAPAKTVKKSAAASSSAATATTATPAKKLVKKATAPAATEEAAPVAKKVAAPVASATETAPSEGPKRKIIKRRTGDGSEAVETPAAKKEVTARESSSENVTADEATEQSIQETQSATPSVVVQAAEVIAPVIPREVYTPRPNAPGTKVISKAPVQRPVERDELLDEFVSRKLKIVQQAPPVVPGSRNEEVTYRTPGGPVGRKPGVAAKPAGAAGTTPAAPAEGFRPFSTFVNVQKEEENQRKGAGGVKSTNPEEVRVADFRKRELVFQPKRKKLPPGKQVKQTKITTPGTQKRKIRIEDKIVVSELAQRMGEKANTILSKLMALGTMVNINQAIDFETASLIATEFGYEVQNIAFDEVAVLESNEVENLVNRPPVITVMGHVDHGKTSLLDAIRNADVASGEAGGITQHIGAYSVTVDGKPITFLDTPGHEAFANMRSRGANLTDIVILVVAADDSIMPQTEEAIKHALAAGVPIIVAANKMDKPGVNIDRLKKDLSVHNVLVEEWGGQVPLVPVSALKRTGIKELLETIQVQAEVLELQADPARPAEGVILEARMEKGRGAVADLLVDKGTLRTGDYIVVGTAYGRVRAMMNDRGQEIKEVAPGFPAEIFGLNDVPAAGDTFSVTKTEADAKGVAENRRKKILEQKSIDLAPKTMSLEELMAKIPNPGVKELNILVKTDVFGSAEAIKSSIEKIKSEKVKAKVISCGVGVITENDILMAKTAKAMVIGFNSKPDSKARDVAKREHIELLHYSIIYELLDAVRESMENLLEPLRKETFMGKAEVKQAFAVSKIGTVAGSVVVDGKIARNAFARVTRGKEIVHEGKIVSLKRFKDDASETIKGQECGIGVEHFDAYMPGDIIQAFHVELVKQSL